MQLHKDHYFFRTLINLARFIIIIFFFSSTLNRFDTRPLQTIQQSPNFDKVIVTPKTNVFSCKRRNKKSNSVFDRKKNMYMHMYVGKVFRHLEYRTAQTLFIFLPQKKSKKKTN